MTSLNFFEQLEREIALAKKDQADTERVLNAAVAAHVSADAKAQRMNRYVDALEDALDMLNSSVGRKPVDARPETLR